MTRAKRASPSTFSRRSFLAAAGLVTAGIALDRYGPDELRVFGSSARAGRDTSPPLLQGAADGAVQLVAAPDIVDLGGRSARTWTFNGSLPGPELRLRAGQLLRAEFANYLPAPTSIHWHGIALRNQMDGVPGLTQLRSPLAPDSCTSSPFLTPGPTFSIPTPGCRSIAGCTAC